MKVDDKGNIHIEANAPRYNNGGDSPLIIISEEADTLINNDYGPSQVESLLRMVMDYPLNKAISDVEDNLDALNHLEKLKK